MSNGQFVCFGAMLVASASERSEEFSVQFAFLHHITIHEEPDTAPVTRRPGETHCRLDRCPRLNELLFLTSL